MRVLKIVGGVVGVLVLAVVGLFVGARFADGPLGPIPGGPLASGAWVIEPVSDWSFAAEVPEIELQLAGDSTSRTTWILVHEGQAIVPASLDFPPGKTWHRRAASRGDAVLRIEGRRYKVRLEKMAEPPVEELRSLVESKYGNVPAGDSGVWFFAVHSVPQPSAGG